MLSPPWGSSPVFQKNKIDKTAIMFLVEILIKNLFLKVWQLHTFLVMSAQCALWCISFRLNDVVRFTHNDAMFAIHFAKQNIISEAASLAQPTSFATGKHHSDQIKSNRESKDSLLLLVGVTGLELVTFLYLLRFSGTLDYHLWQPYGNPKFFKNN